MEIIKFRAWDIERKEFNYLDLRDAVAGDDAYSLCGNQGTKWEEDRENSCTMNCKCEIQQFTGLKDKSLKEIYEGDIINFDNNILLITLGEEVFTLGYKIIKMRDENFADDIRLYRCDTNAKIIGNKFENPELLASVNG